MKTSGFLNNLNFQLQTSSNNPKQLGGNKYDRRLGQKNRLDSDLTPTSYEQTKYATNKEQMGVINFSNTQKITGISKEIVGATNDLQLLSTNGSSSHLRQSYQNLDVHSTKSNNNPQTQQKSTRQSSAQPVNRLLQFNNGQYSNDQNNMQRGTNYEMVQQDENQKSKHRPSSNKRPSDNIQPSQSQENKYNNQVKNIQISNYKGINSQQHKRAPSNGNQPSIDDNKFSQLVTQVPQNVDPKTMLNNIRLALPQQHDQESSKTTTLESSRIHGNEQEEEWLLGPQRREDIGKKTLVLDLDETLVHSSFKPIDNPDIVLPVEIEGSICNIFILVRPGVSQFLKKMHKHYELTIFTASLSKYAEPLVDILDPEKLCSYRLFREHCTYMNNAFVKDLSRLGREMTDVIIVDNSPIAYLLQPENALPILSWYDDMTDRELPRLGNVLERLAYEEDVRKIVKRIIVNNELDPKLEQIYLHQKQRDHSQKERHSHHQNEKGTSSKKINHRYESADNRSKHATIISEQMKKRNGGVGQEDEEIDTFNNNQFEMMVKKQQLMQEQQANQMRIQLMNQKTPTTQEYYNNQYASANQKPATLLKDSKETFALGVNVAQDHQRPMTTKGGSQQRNTGGFFSNKGSNNYNDISASQSQNATPISKRAISVRQSQNQNVVANTGRKERGHSASSATRTSNKNGSIEHSANRKKNTFTNFLSNTQKLSREDPSEKIQSIRGHSQVQTLGSNPQSQHISPRPSTAGHPGYQTTKHSQSHGRHQNQSLGSTQRISSSNNNQFLALQGQSNTIYSLQSSNGHSNMHSHHSKKNSSLNGTQVLKQSLKDLQDMLKLTQNKLQKQNSTNSNKGSSQQTADEISFLKKLSRQSEMQGNNPNQQQQQNSQQQQTSGYASRYSVNSPKYKENLNILNSNGSQQQNPLQSNSQGPLTQINSSNSQSNIILTQSQNFGSTKHQKKVSNPFQIMQMGGRPDDNSLETELQKNYEQHRQQQQQIKIIHNVNNNNQLRQSQVFKQQQQPVQQQQQPVLSNTNKFLNTYLQSMNTTPTAASQNLRSSVNKMFVQGSKEESAMVVNAQKEFSKQFYNQIGSNFAANGKQIQ